MEENKPTNENDWMHMQQTEEMYAWIPFEATFRAGWFKLARKIVPVFDPIGIEGTNLFRAMNFVQVYIIATTVTCISGVPDLLSIKKFVKMQAMFKSIVFENSDRCKILTCIAQEYLLCFIWSVFHFLWVLCRFFSNICLFN